MTRISRDTALALLLSVGLTMSPVAVRAQSSRGFSESGNGVSVGRPPSAPPSTPVLRPPSPPAAPPAPQGIPMPGQGFSPPNQPGFPNRNPQVIYSPTIVYGVPYPVPVPDDSGAGPSYDSPYPSYGGAAPYPSYGDSSYPSYGGASPYPSYGGAPYPNYGAAPPPAAPSSPPDPSSVPGVLVYPTGRYELRGDGGVEPYRWVWIPNPPPPPPAAAPGTPGATSPSDMPTPPTAPPRSRDVTVYRWTDGEGIVHFTDSLDSVPKEYRAQAKPAL